MNKAIIIVTVWLLLASSALGEKHAAEPSLNNPKKPRSLPNQSRNGYR